MRTIRTLPEFWKLTEEATIHTEFWANEKLARLRWLPYESIGQICLQYRFFTFIYTTNLAHILYRLPYGDMRSVLGDIINDELGNGRSERAHINIYDGFLRSLGLWGPDAVFTEDMFEPCLKEVLDQFSALVETQSVYSSMGMTAMMGECLCHIYLVHLEHNLRRNPEIVRRRDRIDWQFWSLHAGPVDDAHKQATRNTINAFLGDRPDKVEELAGGYLQGKELFEEFWNRLHDMYNPAHPVNKQCAVEEIDPTPDRIMVKELVGSGAIVTSPVALFKGQTLTIRAADGTGKPVKLRVVARYTDDMYGLESVEPDLALASVL